MGEAARFFLKIRNAKCEVRNECGFSHWRKSFIIVKEIASHETMFTLGLGAKWVKRHASFSERNDFYADCHSRN